MKPFRERNPVIIGAISLVVLAATLLAAFRAQDLPIIGGGYTIGGSGSSCTANFRLVDNKVAALFYSGNNDRMVGEDGVCEPIIRGCMRRPQSSMLPVSQQTNASAFSQPPAPPTPVQTTPAAPVVDPDAVVRMPTVGR